MIPKKFRVIFRRIFANYNFYNKLNEMNSEITQNQATIKLILTQLNNDNYDHKGKAEETDRQTNIPQIQSNRIYIYRIFHQIVEIF